MRSYRDDGSRDIQPHGSAKKRDTKAKRHNDKQKLDDVKYMTAEEIQAKEENDDGND